MRNKILWMLVSCVMALSLVLASCAPAVVEEEEEVAPPVDEEEVVEEKAVPKVEEPKYGGTLRLVRSASPVGFDPGLTNWSIDNFVGHCYEKPLAGDIDKYGPRGENLFPFCYWGGVAPLDYTKPQLIEGWEFTDPMTLVYHVRQGVHFQNKPPVNGREMDAEDVALSLRRIWEVPRFNTGYWSFVDSVEAIDKWTVQFKLNKFDSAWKWMLGYGWYTMVIPRELVEQDLANKWEYVCGTGPFILTDYVTDTAVNFKKNPDYWDTTTIAGKEYKLPFVDRFTIYIIKDVPTSVAAFRTGKVDVGMNWMPTEALPMLESHPELEHISHDCAGSLMVIHIQCDGGPTEDLRVRRALMLALDNQAMLDKLHMGDGLLMQNPWLQEGFPSYVPLEELPADIRELAEYHPDKAKQLLEEAGYPDGFKIKMMSPTWDFAQDNAAVCAAYWEDIGVHCEIDTRDMGILFATFYAGKQPALMQINRGGLHLCESQAETNPDSLWNIGRWIDPEFHGYLDNALAAREPAERDRWLKEMNLRFMRQVPMIFLPNPATRTLWWPWVKNYYGEAETEFATLNTPFMRIWIDQELKKEMGY